MKNLKSIVLGLCLMLAIPAQQSKAALTFTASGPAGYVAFEMMMLPLGVGGYMLSRDYGGCKLALCADKVFAVAALGVGLFFLDEDTAAPSFGSISESKALELGIDSTDRDSYNDSLDEINMIKNEMILELTDLEKPTLSDANRMWNESADLLDEGAFRALSKVRSSLGNAVSRK